ncbi:MAG TPA: hypothetical protein VI138_01750 [Candidatus Dormibacteraeota bacterium]
MKLPARPGFLAAPALAALVLVGCGGNAASHRTAGAILQAANQEALSGSFQMAFSGQLHVNLSGLTAPGVSAGELDLIQAEINAARLTGTGQVDTKKKDFEISFTLTPLLTQSFHVLYLAGTEYVSENGTTWYLEKATTPSASAAGSLGKFKAAFKSWGQDLRHQATVTNLGQTTIDGQSADHLQTTVSGADLNQAFATFLGQVVGDLGSQASSVSGELPALEALFQFGQATSNSYVLDGSGELARTSVASAMTLNLGELAKLVPSQSGLPTGSVPLTFSFSSDFSDYGKSFDLVKPSHIAPGPLPTPDGLGALTQT